MQRLLNELNDAIENGDRDQTFVKVPWSLAGALVESVSGILEEPEPIKGKLNDDAYALLIHVRTTLATNEGEHHERMRAVWKGVGALMYVSETDRYAKAGLSEIEKLLDRYDRCVLNMLGVVAMFEAMDGDDDAR